MSLNARRSISVRTPQVQPEYSSSRMQRSMSSRHYQSSLYQPTAHDRPRVRGIAAQVQPEHGAGRVKRPALSRHHQLSMYQPRVSDRPSMRREASYDDDDADYAYPSSSYHPPPIPAYHRRHSQPLRSILKPQNGRRRHGVRHVQFDFATYDSEEDEEPQRVQHRRDDNSWLRKLKHILFEMGKE